MIGFYIFLYWLIGVYTIVHWWTRDIDVGIGAFVLAAIVGWLAWPFFAVHLLWIRFFPEEIILFNRRDKK